MAVTVHVLVWLGVAVQLVCCVGLTAMRRPIDRLHYAAAATVAGPTLVAAAVCFQEGLFSTNGLNAVAVAVLLALLGGAVGVATARAIRLSERGTLESSRAERERGS
jgi:multisubunit Na+/H+ antiporter MnhG subunit